MVVHSTVVEKTEMMIKTSVTVKIQGIAPDQELVHRVLARINLIKRISHVPGAKVAVKVEVVREAEKHTVPVGTVPDHARPDGTSRAGIRTAGHVPVLIHPTDRLLAGIEMITAGLAPVAPCLTGVGILETGTIRYLEDALVFSD